MNVATGCCGHIPFIDKIGSERRITDVDRSARCDCGSCLFDTMGGYYGHILFIDKTGSEWRIRMYIDVIPDFQWMEFSFPSLPSLLSPLQL